MVRLVLQKGGAAFGGKVPVIFRGAIKIRLNKVIPGPEGLMREEGLDFLFAIAAKA